MMEHIHIEWLIKIVVQHSWPYLDYNNGDANPFAYWDICFDERAKTLKFSSWVKRKNLYIWKRVLLSTNNKMHNLNHKIVRPYLFPLVINNNKCHQTCFYQKESSHKERVLISIRSREIFNKRTCDARSPSGPMRKIETSSLLILFLIYGYV